MLNLSDKRILFTGISSATSNALAKHLHETGAQLVFADEDESLLKEICSELGSECSYIKISTTEILNGSNDQALNLKSIGEIDGFVFALGKGGVKPIAFNKPPFVEELVKQNYLLFAELTRLLIKNKNLVSGSSIVALSSVSSIKGLKTKAAYCASKAALDACVRSYAAELAQKKIRVNSVQKGWVTTDMDTGFIQNSINISDNSDLEKQLLGPINPYHLAMPVAFLLSDASAAITGTAMLVDGGYSL